MNSIVPSMLRYPQCDTSLTQAHAEHHQQPLTTDARANLNAGTARAVHYVLLRSRAGRPVEQHERRIISSPREEAEVARPKAKLATSNVHICLRPASMHIHTQNRNKMLIQVQKKIIQQNWLISHVFKLLPITPGSASGKVEVVMWLELVLLGVIALSPTTKRNLFWPTV